MEENVEKTEEVQEQEQVKKKSKKKQGNIFTLLIKIILWCGAVIILVFLTLFISAKLAGFDSMMDMIDFIRGHY